MLLLYTTQSELDGTGWLNAQVLTKQVDVLGFSDVPIVDLALDPILLDHASKRLDEDKRTCQFVQSCPPCNREQCMDLGPLLIVNGFGRFLSINIMSVGVSICNNGYAEK